MIFDEKDLPLVKQLQAACAAESIVIDGLLAYMEAGGKDGAIHEQFTDRLMATGKEVARISDQLELVRLDQDS